MMEPSITESEWAAARLIWDYQHMHHQLRPAEAAIALGSHDLGVADFAAQLYHRGLFPKLVFTGANSPTTIARFPRGEAEHFRERAISLGVPAHAILIELRATNTGENIAFSREVLRAANVKADTVILVCMPGMERRAYATCRKVWPDVEAICASEPVGFDEYVASFDHPHLVIDDLVGDLQRVIEYPRLGYAIRQDVPESVRAACTELLSSGFTSRELSL